LDEDKVVVLPYGVSSAFRPMPREAAQKWVQTSFGLRSPFVLTVGDLVPRKNHVGLIGAFEKLVRAYPQLPHQLVIVGKENWGASLIRAAAKHSRVADRIHFTGFVSDEGLLRLYGACDLFAYPSFYEGFGLPILEAMACGRAVACSNSRPSVSPRLGGRNRIGFEGPVVKCGASPAHGAPGHAARCHI
jgi:glycosyltransferase involved in cell wall biosynthesis